MPVHCHDSESTDDSLISYRVVGVSAVWAISMLVVIFLHVLYYLRVYAKTTWCLALCVSNGMAWGCAMVILVQVYMSPHMGTSSSYAPYKELYEHSPSYKAIFWSIILSTITTWIMFFRMATWHYSVEATTIYMVRLRRKTVVMLFCFPLMSTMCFVNIWYPSFFVYQELLMCIIDVAVIMLFTAIIAQHLGGWRRTVQFLEQLAPVRGCSCFSQIVSSRLHHFLLLHQPSRRRRTSLHPRSSDFGTGACRTLHSQRSSLSASATCSSRAWWGYHLS
mmetsp:Transcript_36929/g.99437  ORF Transcript_36929/g.99437 Transcript_36929/m.99437 type:complete len:277 (+) Transcript_36929:155-985(+)